jgi:hypothetical protein
MMEEKEEVFGCDVRDAGSEMVEMVDGLGEEKLTEVDVIRPNDKAISDKQKISETRFSARLLEQKVEKTQVKYVSTKKRSLEGTSLSDQNSFAVLNNDVIADIAGDMGIIIQTSDFDKVELVKDLEIARHAIRNPIVLPDANMDDSSKLDGTYVQDEIPLLDWLDDDSEAENFVLVQYRKKKKKQGICSMENSVSKGHVRRSQRTTPSVYRSVDGLEIPKPNTKRNNKNKK